MLYMYFILLIQKHIAAAFQPSWQRLYFSFLFGSLPGGRIPTALGHDTKGPLLVP